MADPKTGKVLATRCPQSECKLYIDLVLGTTGKEYQDALDEARKLEPQHPEHLPSLESSEDITSSQSSEDFITSSQSSNDLKSLNINTTINIKVNKYLFVLLYMYMWQQYAIQLWNTLDQWLENPQTKQKCIFFHMGDLNMAWGSIPLILADACYFGGDLTHILQSLDGSNILENWATEQRNKQKKSLYSSISL